MKGKILIHSHYTDWSLPVLLYRYMEWIQFLVFHIFTLFTDIVYGICAGGSAVDIPPSFCNLEIGTCKRAPDVPNTKWYCIVVAGWNSYIRILNKPVGSMSSKLRHLQLLGYRPVVVSYISWMISVHGPFTAQIKLVFIWMCGVSYLCIFRFRGLNGNNCL